jgi:hypothetical protein
MKRRDNGPYYKLRGQEGCEVQTPTGRCRKPLVGYINDGDFDKHVCREHWAAYHEPHPTEAGRRLGKELPPRPDVRPMPPNPEPSAPIWPLGLMFIAIAAAAIVAHMVGL